MTEIAGMLAIVGILAKAVIPATPGTHAVEGSSKSVDANNYESPYTETLPTSLLSSVYFQCPSFIGYTIKIRKNGQLKVLSGS